MAARVMKVETGFAVQFVDFTHTTALRSRPVGNALLNYALQDRPERCGRHPERVMLTGKIGLDRLEQNGGLVPELDCGEDALASWWCQSKNAGQEIG